MKFHGIKMLGKIFAQIVANISSVSWNSGHISNLVLDQNTGTLFYGDPSSNSFRTLTDVPFGSIFLFETDTSISGYTLLTTVDDAVVFITRGSSAGGETGGTAKSGGTWSMGAHSHGLASHYHTVSSHFHTMSHTHNLTSHRHQWFDYSSTGVSYSWYSNGSQINYITYYGLAQTSTGPAGGEENTTAYSAMGDFWTNYSSVATGGPSTSNTGASSITTGGPSTTTDTQASVTTWRPKGRNVTRQQRV
jgi:hypothetical protein